MIHGKTHYFRSIYHEMTYCFCVFHRVKAQLMLAKFVIQKCFDKDSGHQIQEPMRLSRSRCDREDQKRSLLSNKPLFHQKALVI
jgi:hypothetical protein